MISPLKKFRLCCIKLGKHSKHSKVSSQPLSMEPPEPRGTTNEHLINVPHPSKKCDL